MSGILFFETHAVYVVVQVVLVVGCLHTDECVQLISGATEPKRHGR